MTIKKFCSLKGNIALACATAYDYITGRIADAAGVPLVLVGDSLATTALGHSTTIPATIDIMVHHASAVRRAVKNAIVVGDMPFLTYTSPDEALRNAGRLVREAGCDAVKLEGGTTHAHIIKALVENGIPVMAHIGLQPQSVKSTGYAVRGKEDSDTERLRADLVAVVEAGAFAVTLECVVPEVADELTRICPVPTISCGSSTGCDGQFLVMADLLGLSEGPMPKFAHAYAQLFNDAVTAVKAYKVDVEARKFPFNTY